MSAGKWCPMGNERSEDVMTKCIEGLCAWWDPVLECCGMVSYARGRNATTNDGGNWADYEEVRKEMDLEDKEVEKNAHVKPHRCRVGVCGRNERFWPAEEYELIQVARIETLKMLSLTAPSVFELLRGENPDIEFIVRLYDDRMGKHGHPTAAEFVAKMSPIIKRLRPYATKFEIHNEPNHVDGIEGWGATNEDAYDFRDWYEVVLWRLQGAFPWAKFGFPGLALNHPHRDLPWLNICRDVIRNSHWLGCHTYWQYDNMMSRDWGLRFVWYHEKFPNMPIEITEFGDSTPDLNPHYMAEEYVKYYQELNKHPYLRSASAFIASSPDPQWAPFCWMDENGMMKPVVDAVGNRQ